MVRAPLTRRVTEDERLNGVGLYLPYYNAANVRTVVEHLTVISGTFNMGTGDKLDTSKTMALTAGSIAIIQAKVPHFAWTTEETIVQVHGVGPTAFNFVNPDDDPKKKK